MEYLFWILVSTAILQAFAIVSVGNAIKTLLDNDTFKQKLRKHRDSVKKISAIALLLASTTLLPAQENSTVVVTSYATEESVNAFVILNLFFLSILLYLKNMYNKLYNIDVKEKVVIAKEEAIKKARRKWWMKTLTDSVSIEEEYKVATDHEYDGITELDNNLPPWWKWGFYLSIVFAVVYLLHYHVFKTGDLQISAYEKSKIEAEAKIAQYLKDQALNVDENTATYLTEASDLSAGKSLFMESCKVCHGAAGEGLVGPNLTDDYWIYGGDIKDIFKTIKYGAKNGMKSWKDELNPVQMQQVASFIKSLKGTNPPNAKHPQGELYVEEEVAEINENSDK